MSMRYTRKMQSGQFATPYPFLPEDPAAGDGGQGGGGTPAGGAPAPEADADDGGVKAFAEMTAEEKVDFLTSKNRRLEDQVRGKSQDPSKDVKTLQRRIRELEPLAEQIQALEKASQTEAERAVAAAREAGEKAGRETALADARKTYGAQIVGVQLDAAADRKGMTGEALRKLAGDPSRFLDDDGVDADALSEFLAALPDKSAAPEVTPPARRDLGGGSRTGAKVDGLQVGEDLYAQRHRRRTTSAT